MYAYTSPFAEIDRLFADMSQLIGRARSDDAGRVDVWADDDGVLVSAAVPGLSAADVRLDVQHDVLRLGAASARDASLPEGATWQRRERSQHGFERVVQLPFAVDAASAQASLANGVLSVRLRRAESDKPRRITINAN